MNQAKVLNFFGLLLIMFGISFVIPLLVAVFYGESLVMVFGLGMSILVLLGFLSWFLTKDDKNELSLSDGFVITVLFWIVLSVSGSIPFLLFGFGVVDSFFESMSGITTTGATVSIAVGGWSYAATPVRTSLSNAAKSDASIECSVF